MQPKYLYLGLAVTGVLAGKLECGSSNGSGDLTCNLTTNQASAGGSVTYVASQAGDGKMTQLQYATDGGLQTVPNPTLPVSYSVTLTTGRAQILATGTVGDGGLAIEYSRSAAGGGGFESDSDNCSQ